MKEFFLAIKTIREIVNVLKDIIEWFKDRKLRKIERQVEERNSAVARINEKIEQESKKEQPDDEVIKELHRRLNNIAGKL